MNDKLIEILCLLKNVSICILLIAIYVIILIEEIMMCHLDKTELSVTNECDMETQPRQLELLLVSSPK